MKMNIANMYPNLRSSLKKVSELGTVRLNVHMGLGTSCLLSRGLFSPLLYYAHIFIIFLFSLKLSIYKRTTA